MNVGFLIFVSMSLAVSLYMDLQPRKDPPFKYNLRDVVYWNGLTCRVSATPTYIWVPFSMLKALPIEDTHRRYWDSMYYKWEETYHPPIKTVSEKDTPLSRYHFSEDD